MKVKESDLELFRKLKLKSAIDLALILPKKIENLTLTKEPMENENCVQELRILSHSFKTNMLLVKAYCEAWGVDVSLVFFHFSKWHMGVFKVGASLLLSGKLGFFNHTWQFYNPKIIKKAGVFEPKYQISGIKDSKIQSLIETYVSYENLKESGIADKFIFLLLNLHAYDEKSFELFKNLEHFLEDLKYIEIYNFLKRLKHKKNPSKAYKIKLFDIEKWLKTLPFSPTKDQLNAIKDIREDLSKDVAKRRVIMGDVGCGKTLVLLAAALSVYPKQALLMAPTSILAQQLFEEAKKLLPPFMNILFIKGGKKEKGLKEQIKNAHLIIGTHALIYEESFEAVLVMIDEQHRFGSNQRQKISQLSSKKGLSPHFIQFSATPIPRTLSMIQSELLNFSFIKQMPFKKDISTYCVQNEDFVKIKAKIDAEIAKKHQVIIIYPLVNESEKIPYLSLEQAKVYWQKHYEKVFVTHGKDKEKDVILQEFKERGDILLSTTVVEVGISLPRLSTIVIVGAERLGLATLHQLRGRVGRVGLKSYCYLYTKLREIPQRLSEFAKTLDGFEIAELDLKNRLSGDLLDGYIQHGNEFKFFDFANDEAILARVKKDLG
ncbi:ATP-dependent DNA helicase RecG [Campylobacter vulpis]|uniref:ATP-dependent DNA helicase RecG n=1 Tax=Campylobacter vulpis TaxID=1655500 RepID=A0A2G4R5W9_9BACT|nr:ATP-dependent DNA helicase RecG [Campylobacter vulpis]MBS4274739.1 ATP-dependent DNA helicase RecG [Campylobacter vulpis]MBS4306285.1 ATP-dependent DNA helicase RecG [Campylobacter vulpis]MBS4313626.1 ATP-dependent DNA helicase RecG [Campylobacter vulpis]MBS4329343.1 ATP-dependent DNA helicase RecG [Campylobacter vulpis]MBS4332005.1 ATP-dependent DNA helicase RecG [Campylobacter vulpis]